MMRETDIGNANLSQQGRRPQNQEPIPAEDGTRYCLTYPSKCTGATRGKGISSSQEQAEAGPTNEGCTTWSTTRWRTWPTLRECGTTYTTCPVRPRCAVNWTSSPASRQDGADHGGHAGQLVRKGESPDLREGQGEPVQAHRRRTN